MYKISHEHEVMFKMIKKTLTSVLEEPQKNTGKT